MALDVPDLLVIIVLRQLVECVLESDDVSDQILGVDGEDEEGSGGQLAGGAEGGRALGGVGVVLGRNLEKQTIVRESTVNVRF